MKQPVAASLLALSALFASGVAFAAEEEILFDPLHSLPQVREGCAGGLQSAGIPSPRGQARAG